MPAGNSTVVAQPCDLYARALAARQHSEILAGQLRAAKRGIQANWQLVQAAWDQAEQNRAVRLVACTDSDRLRRSAYARLHARLSSMPVIEQAKGIIMAQRGWPEDQAFEALRQASQRGNVKIRDLAAAIVARATSPAHAQRPAGHAPTATQQSDGVIPALVPAVPASTGHRQHSRKAAG